MADFTLKETLFSNNVIEEMANELNLEIPNFNKDEFITDVLDSSWKELELKQRMRHITLQLRKQLPADFVGAVTFLCNIAKKILAESDKEFHFGYMSFVDYVEVYGLDDFDKSINALEILTCLMSAEFAIRPFIIKYPEKAMKQMFAWSNHDDYRVRRLASEGCRPRLPWGIALTELKKNPSTVLPILENLKNDSAETVRRSVANNLNDISKDNPDVVLDICEKWFDENKEVNWIIKHALRGLLKKGNTRALRLFGFCNPDNIEISSLKLEHSSIKIGEHSRFSFDVKNSTSETAKLRLEYIIDYMKANGKHSPKVFQIKEFDLEADGKENVVRKLDFQNRTTRKHYIGEHKIQVVVNGVRLASEVFSLE